MKNKQGERDEKVSSLVDSGNVIDRSKEDTIKWRETRAHHYAKESCTHLATAVLELTSLEPVVAEGSSLGVPLQRLGTVASTEFVVGIEESLLLRSSELLLGLGLDATLLEVDVITRDGVVALEFVKGKGGGVKLEGRGADLGRG